MFHPTSARSCTADLARWVVVPKALPQAKVRLFCLPFAGGGIFLFRTWPYHLPDWIEVGAIQLPGREERREEKPYTHLATLALDLAEILSLALAQDDRPYAIFGHSMGALIGFEVARELLKSGKPAPIHFFASGRRAPHFPDENLLHHLPDEPFQVGLRRFRGMSEKLFSNEQLMRFFLPTLRADFTLFETHRFAWGEPLPCGITAFGGNADIEASLTQLQGWQEHTVGTFELRMFPGDHFFVRQMQSQLLSAVVQELGELLVSGETSVRSNA
jgi:surfactin synthase thioesterase subunit